MQTADAMWRHRAFRGDVVNEPLRSEDSPAHVRLDESNDRDNWARKDAVRYSGVHPLSTVAFGTPQSAEMEMVRGSVF